MKILIVFFSVKFFLADHRSGHAGSVPLQDPNAVPNKLHFASQKFPPMTKRITLYNYIN